MKKVSFLCFVLLVCIGLLAGCASTEPPVSSDSSPSESSLPASEPSQPLEENDAASEETPAESGDTPTGVPSVYMTTDISADVYKRQRIYWRIVSDRERKKQGIP